MRPELRSIVREELLRSIAWFGLGLVGWPILAEELAWLETNALTVFGFPLLTWAGLTATMIAVRAVTDSELQVQTPRGLSASLLAGMGLAGVGGIYLVAAGGYSALWVSVAYVGVSLATVVWHWYAHPPRGEPHTPG
jgi:hypothetical protein